MNDYRPPLINLLPWRLSQRVQEKRIWCLKLLTTVLLSFCLIIVSHIFMAIRVNHQIARNDLIEKENQEFDKKIIEIYQLKKNRDMLLTHTAVIESLQISRYETVKIFNELNRVLPNGIILDELSRKGELITLSGYSESNARISELMKNIEDSNLLKDPRLKEIKTGEKIQGDKQRFQLQITLKKLIPAQQGGT